MLLRLPHPRASRQAASLCCVPPVRRPAAPRGDEPLPPTVRRPPRGECRALSDGREGTHTAFPLPPAAVLPCAFPREASAARRPRGDPRRPPPAVRCVAALRRVPVRGHEGTRAALLLPPPRCCPAPSAGARPSCFRHWSTCSPPPPGRERERG